MKKLMPILLILLMGILSPSFALASSYEDTLLRDFGILGDVTIGRDSAIINVINYNTTSFEKAIAATHCIGSMIFFFENTIPGYDIILKYGDKYYKTTARECKHEWERRNR